VVQLLAVAPIAAVFVATSGASALSAWTETFSLWWAIPLAVPIVVFVFWPHGLIALANSLLSVVGRDPLPLELTRRELVILLGISLAGWLLFSTAFTSLAIAVLPPDAAVGGRLPVLMAAYPMAFAIGFVSLITPSGLAVREGALFVLLSPIVGGAQALVIALGMRVWEIVLDAAVATVAMLSLTRRS
jgi:hypothetical protein